MVPFMEMLTTAIILVARPMVILQFINCMLSTYTLRIITHLGLQEFQT